MKYLLPRRLDWWPVALLVGGVVISGFTASALSPFDWQVLRCARYAVCVTSVYNHVLRLPMAFFDRAITGQLVSRITH